VYLDASDVYEALLNALEELRQGTAEPASDLGNRSN